MVSDESRLFSPQRKNYTCSQTSKYQHGSEGKVRYDISRNFEGPKKTFKAQESLNSPARQSRLKTGTDCSERESKHKVFGHMYLIVYLH